jgi:capsid protein
VAEEGRPLLMPANIASGNSSKYNYASGRLDNQSYELCNDVDREDVENFFLEPAFEQWLRETLAELTGTPPSAIDPQNYPHEWHWDTRGHVDPAKEANAQDTDLRNGTISFPSLYARQGLDWRTEFTKQAQSLGLSLEEFQQLLRRALYERSLPAGTGGQGPGAGDDSADDETPAPKPPPTPRRR